MTPEERAAALEGRVEEVSQRLMALERRMDHQASNEELHRRKMGEMKEGMEALEEQTPANSATREVMWRRIEALEGAPSEDLPPMLADILRRLAALEERIRGQR
jgi:chromosome segregation ATPase